MTKRSLVVDGAEWTVTVVAHAAVPGGDELPLLFAGRAPDGARVRRLSRYSPRGRRPWGAVLAELTEAELVALLRQSQPAWTAPELGYGRA